MKNKSQRQNNNENKKKKRILFIWLFGILGAGAVATAVTVPLVLLNKKEPGPEPVVGPEFSVETGATMWDPIYTTLKLDWTPADHEIEFSNFEFKYNGSEKTTQYIDIVESTTGSVSLNLTFSDLIYQDDILDGVLSFDYNDKTTGTSGQKTIEGISISKYSIPEQPIFETQPATGDDTIEILRFSDQLEEKPKNLIIPSYIFIDSVPTKVIQIADTAFSNAEIETLVISNTITNIGYNAFYYCEGLTKVTFAEHSQIRLISEMLFSECYALQSIYLPGSITKIGDFAFYDSGLNSITFGGTIAEWNDITLGNDCWTGVTEQYVHCTDGDTPLNPES